MKKVYKLSLLLCLLMFFVTCNKDPEAPKASMNFIEQEPEFNIEEGKVSVLFRGTLDYKGIIKGVTLDIWTETTVSAPEHYTMYMAEGSIILKVTNLNPDTKYNYCYYVNYGISPDYEIGPNTITTPSLPEPTVAEPIVATVDITSQGVSGNVIDNGGASIIEYGICWGSEPDPDISGQHDAIPVLDGADGMGPFLVMHRFEPGMYYVRAYAKNSAGMVGYGDNLLLVAE